MSYIRFVILRNDEQSGRRQGLFQALSAMHHHGALLPHEDQLWIETYQWFRENLEVPQRFARSTRPHAKKVALSWFKDSASLHIQKMRVLSHILHDHGVNVDVVRSDRPGYVVYEDEHQVVAEPFSNTLT